SGVRGKRCWCRTNGAGLSRSGDSPSPYAISKRADRQGQGPTSDAVTGRAARSRGLPPFQPPPTLRVASPPVRSGGAPTVQVLLNPAAVANAAPIGRTDRRVRQRSTW